MGLIVGTCFQKTCQRSDSTRAHYMSPPHLSSVGQPAPMPSQPPSVLFMPVFLLLVAPAALDPREEPDLFQGGAEPGLLDGWPLPEDLRRRAELEARARAIVG